MIKIFISAYFLASIAYSEDLKIVDLLSPKYVNEAISASHDGSVRIVGGVMLKAPQGNIVYDEDLVILAKWLNSNKKLPPLQDLVVMLEDKNTAVRVFAFSGLKLKMFNLPKFNPYFSPGYQDEEVRAIRRSMDIIVNPR